MFAYNEEYLTSSSSSNIATTNTNEAVFYRFTIDFDASAQQMYFALNVEEQVRGYYIAQRDIGKAYYYKTFDEGPNDTIIVINKYRTEEMQQSYFLGNSGFQTQGYYIATRDISSSGILYYTIYPEPEPEPARTRAEPEPEPEPEPSLNQSQSRA